MRVARFGSAPSPLTSLASAGLDRCLAEHARSGKASTQNLFAIIQGQSSSLSHTDDAELTSPLQVDSTLIYVTSVCKL